MTRRHARAWLAGCTGLPEPCTGAWCLGAPSGGVAIVRHRGGTLRWVQGMHLGGDTLLVCSGSMVPDGLGGLMAEPGPGVEALGAQAPLTVGTGCWHDALAALPTWAGVQASA